MHCQIHTQFGHYQFMVKREFTPHEYLSVKNVLQLVIVSGDIPDRKLCAIGRFRSCRSLRAALSVLEYSLRVVKTGSRLGCGPVVV